MSDDLISRQALYEKITDLEARALDYVGKLIERDGDEPSEEWKVWTAILNERTAFKHDVMDAQVVGTEMSLTKWIPCSERLPVIGEHYVSEPCIVYCSNGAYGFAELEENIFGQVGWNCERDDEYHEPLGEVIAWMPLPESYEE